MTTSLTVTFIGTATLLLEVRRGDDVVHLLTDPVEAWLRCGPVAARHTVVAGRTVVEDGALVHPGLDEMLRRHRAAAGRLQRLVD